MASNKTTAMAPEEQVDDLQRRLKLLEGERKAAYETSQLNIKQNKEIIKHMTQENMELRTQIKHLRMTKPQSTEQQVDGKMAEVQILQRKLDLLKHDSMQKSKYFYDLDCKLNELSMDSSLPKTEDSPQMRYIRVLENRLDKAMIKHNEAQGIRRTYEAIAKRMKEERVGFDNQLAAIEQILRAKERDYEELLLLSHDAYHAKEMSQAELHRFEQGVMEERIQRDQDVQEKKILVQQRVEMNHRLEQREKLLKKQQEQDTPNDWQKKDLPATQDSAAAISNDFNAAELRKVKEYEDAWNRIYEATGVSDVNEIIQKFLTQEETRRNLTNLTKENQAAIDILTEKRRRLRFQVDDLKFSSGGTVSRRQQIDEFEKALVESNEKLQRNRRKFERLAKMRIETKLGIAHLCDNLAAVKLGDEAPIEMSDDTIEDVLQQCGLKIGKLMAKTILLDDRSKLDDAAYEDKWLARNHADVRIKLLEGAQDSDDDDDELDEEMDEDIWDRSRVKEGCVQIVEQQQAKSKRKDKSKKGPN